MDIATLIGILISFGLVIASILMGTVGMSFIGAEIAVLLMPATALLAIASGLVFSR